MTISIVVAHDLDRGIGRDNQLLWHLPNDLKQFKALTLGKPIVMGRKTFESIGRPLPGRPNWILSRKPPATHADNVRWFQSPDAILAHYDELKAQSSTDDDCELMIIGGADIYRQFLPMVQQIYLTEVEARLPADAVFPEIDLNDWHLASDTSYCMDERHPYNYRFKLLRRKAYVDHQSC